MIIYIISLCLSLLIYYIYNRYHEENTFLKIFISLLPMFFVSATRYDVGWDYMDIYVNGFNMIGKGYMPFYFTEIPFDLLLKLIYVLFNGNYVFMFIICSLITFLFLSKAISDQSINPFFSIILIFLIRYFFLTMNIVRQGIAMSIILFSLKYLINGDKKKYFLCVLFASCFHVSSLVYIIVYYVVNFDFKNKENIKKIAIIFSASIMILILIINYTKYGNYIGSKFDNKDFLTHEFILSSAILFLATFIKRKYTINSSQSFSVYYKLQIITWLISLFSYFLPLADRLIWLFYIQNIVFIPLLINEISNRNIKIISISIIIFITVVNVYMQTIYSDSYNILPYNSILFLYYLLL